MQKICFNDNFGLTDLVLRKLKTQFRKPITNIDFYNAVDWKALEEGDFECVCTENGYEDIRECGQYAIGEIVAVGQCYEDICGFENLNPKYNSSSKGWTNKMLVKASEMPHHIRITNIRVEKMQYISEDDCMAEGIQKVQWKGFDEKTKLWSDIPDLFKYKHNVPYGEHITWFDSYKEAYAEMMQTIYKKVSYDENPYCFVYDFELLD